MAKKKVNKTNKTKKDVKKEIENMSSGVTTDIYSIIRIVFWVMVFFAVFYLITLYVVGDGVKKTEEPETVIQYQEILAGSSFALNDSEYYVVYYDFTDSELSNLASSVSTYLYAGTKRLYVVDMSNVLNKNYEKEKSNKKVEKIEDLAIKGPTLIRFKDGKVNKYIEGSDNIVTELGQ